MPFDTCDGRIERWPLRTPFRIARGIKSEAELMTVTPRRDGIRGRCEGCPYPLYGETPELTVAAVERVLEAIDAASDAAADREALLARGRAPPETPSTPRSGIWKPKQPEPPSTSAPACPPPAP